MLCAPKFTLTENENINSAFSIETVPIKIPEMYIGVQLVLYKLPAGSLHTCDPNSIPGGE